MRTRSRWPRWDRDDMRKIALLREDRVTWREIGVAYDCSEGAVKGAWSYWWAKQLRRHEKETA